MVTFHDEKQKKISLVWNLGEFQREVGAYFNHFLTFGNTQIPLQYGVGVS